MCVSHTPNVYRGALPDMPPEQGSDAQIEPETHKSSETPGDTCVGYLLFCFEWLPGAVKAVFCVAACLLHVLIRLIAFSNDTAYIPSTPY